MESSWTKKLKPSDLSPPHSTTLRFEKQKCIINKIKNRINQDLKLVTPRNHCEIESG